MTTPPPEMLAAAEKIDVARYMGHSERPWTRDLDDKDRIILRDAKGSDIARMLNVHKESDHRLCNDAPLIPALTHQRDEARRQRDDAQETALANMRLVAEETKKSDSLRRRCEELEGAMALLIPLVEETREVIVDSNTYPPGNESSLKDGSKEDVERIDAALSIDRAALTPPGGEG